MLTFIVNFIFLRSVFHNNKNVNFLSLNKCKESETRILCIMELKSRCMNG